jgi:hypothetical protein
LDYFTIRLEEAFRIRIKIPKVNVNPKPESYINSVINAEIMKTIEVICKPGREIYRYAIVRNTSWRIDEHYRTDYQRMC